MIFGDWEGDNGGKIHCSCIFGEDKGCDVCDRKLFIEIPGPPERAIVGHVEDCMRSALLIVQSIEFQFPRNPIEFFEQPAKWVAALEYLTPYANLELKAAREAAIQGK